MSLPETIRMTDDDIAESLWQVALLVENHERIRGRTARQLAHWEFEEWERIIPRVSGERTYALDLYTSAITALVIAMRAVTDEEHTNTQMRQGDDMTDDNPTDEVRPETEVEGDLVAQHLAFKRRATELAHRFGDEKNYCRDFDAILLDVGLPPRPSYYGDRWSEYDGPKVTLESLVGESIEAEFKAWQAKTMGHLLTQARYYGVETGPIREVLTKIGFPMTVTRQVQVRGTFTIPLEVETIEGADLIDALDRRWLREQVYNSFYGDQVTWKVVDPAHAPASDAENRPEAD